MHREKMLLLKYGNQLMRQMSIYLMLHWRDGVETSKFTDSTTLFQKMLLTYYYILMDPDFDSIDDDIHGTDEESDKE